MLQLGNRTQRAGMVAAVASALVPVVALPHVFEDLEAGIFADLGLSALTAGLVVGAGLTAQLVGALAGTRDRRIGYVVVLLAAVAWIVLAIIDHPAAFVPGDFREGMISRLAVWALVAVQAVAAVAAFRALRGGRRTSFSGTGSFTGGGSSYGS